MQNVCDLEPFDIIMLAEAATRADMEGSKLRVQTGDMQGRAYLKFKVGEGMWSPPLWSRKE